MKRRHLLLVALSLILTVCMCLSLAGCGKKTQLPTPVVTIGTDGVATWDEIENASGYAYKLDDGEEQATDKTSVTLTDGQSIQVKAIGKGKKILDSEWSDKKTYTAPDAKPQTLATPSVTISDDGTAQWSKVTGATGYKYKIDNGEEKSTTNLAVQLKNGESIVVKAVGDGKTYTDSEWSKSQKYTAKETAVMTHAEYLAAKKGDAVKVQGIVTGITSDRIYFQDADGGYLAYYGSKNPPEEVKIGSKIQAEGTLDIYNGLFEITNPTVLIGGEDTPIAPVDVTAAVTAASAMTDTALVNLQSMFVTLTGVTLEKDADGNYWLAVGSNKAQLFVGSGKSHVLSDAERTALTAELDENLGMTADVKGYVALHQNAFQIVPAKDTLKIDTTSIPALLAPTVTVNKVTGVATWTAVENATKYVYQLKSGDGDWGNDVEVATTAPLSVTLADGQSIRVMAIGDGENHKDSSWSVTQSYTMLTVSTHAQYLASKKGDTLMIEGVVTGIVGKNVYLQDSDGGYYVYNYTSLSGELAIGKTVVAVGEIDVYNGLWELKSASVDVKDVAAATVTPVDITSVFTGATGLDDAALLAKQSMLVTIKGVTLVEVSEDGKYFYFSIGEKKAPLYMSGSLVLDTTALNELKA